MWNFADVIDEDDTTVGEAVNDDLVVHDFVVAVHRWFKGPNHPRESLDRHLDSCAKAAWSSEKNFVDCHDRGRTKVAADIIDQRYRSHASVA
jgi:hypothetical protein